MTKNKSNSLIKTKSLFDHLNHVREKKDINYFSSLSDADKKSWSNYMICRFLSMQPEIIELVNEIQKYQTLPPEKFYQCCIEIVPRGRGFFPYIKGNKETHSEKLIEIMKIHFSESKRNIVECLSLLNKNEVKSIVMMYGYTEKEANKILTE
jgi:hypothetical protein